MTTITAQYEGITAQSVALYGTPPPYSVVRRGIKVAYSFAPRAPQAAGITSQDYTLLVETPKPTPTASGSGTSTPTGSVFTTFITSSTMVITHQSTDTDAVYNSYSTSMTTFTTSTPVTGPITTSTPSSSIPSMTTRGYYFPDGAGVANAVNTITITNARDSPPTKTYVLTPVTRTPASTPAPGVSLVSYTITAQYNGPTSQTIILAPETARAQVSRYTYVVEIPYPTTAAGTSGTDFVTSSPTSPASTSPTASPSSASGSTSPSSVPPSTSPGTSSASSSSTTPSTVLVTRYFAQSYFGDVAGDHSATADSRYLLTPSSWYLVPTTAPVMSRGIRAIITAAYDGIGTRSLLMFNENPAASTYTVLVETPRAAQASTTSSDVVPSSSSTSSTPSPLQLVVNIVHAESCELQLIINIVHAESYELQLVVNIIHAKSCELQLVVNIVHAESSELQLLLLVVVVVVVVVCGGLEQFVIESHFDFLDFAHLGLTHHSPDPLSFCNLGFADLNFIDHGSDLDVWQSNHAVNSYHEQPQSIVQRSSLGLFRHEFSLHSIMYILFPWLQLDAVWTDLGQHEHADAYSHAHADVQAYDNALPLHAELVCDAVAIISDAASSRQQLALPSTSLNDKAIDHEPPSPSPSPSSSPAPAPSPSPATRRCTPENNGQLVCKADNKNVYALCDNGRVRWQPVAPGTQCVNNAIVASSDDNAEGNKVVGTASTPAQQTQTQTQSPSPNNNGAPSTNGSTIAPQPVPTTGAQSSRCPSDGKLYCNGEALFGLCNWGVVQWQSVAPGTKCVDGAITYADTQAY
ncbi:hypothetical protein BKA81DRAFT_433675 [Phyllosticta paracitricarpa]